ncbi:MAG: KOW domain-containing RNA-binding protein [Lachnospiraceae bacterium]|jgi:ribosomal protein L14E/L6E/L27E|nr:KOW domain-containing RNA-binding protein [Lachnospiraceae bacterium]
MHGQEERLPVNDRRGQLAISRSGHDKGDIFIIIAETDEYLYVADGRSRTIDKPKRKNKKHLQIINKTVDNGLLERLKAQVPIYNEEIRYFISTNFNRSNV